MSGFVNISLPVDPSTYINTAEIEAVLSNARGGSVVSTRSGREYRTDLSTRKVLDAIAEATT